MKPEVCPQCGTEVPAEARACPGCGSDERTGWSEQARYDGLDLPSQEFDYDDFVQREFSTARRNQYGPKWLWVTVAVLVVLLVVFGLVL